MITAILSPAKTQDFSPVTDQALLQAVTKCDFLKEASQLISRLKTYSPEQLRDLMKISDKLALLNFERYHEWQLPFNVTNAKPAVLLFRGDVYTGLDAASLSVDDLVWANQHVRILSGLYGLLRPLDLIKPYRLEMGVALSNDKGNDLYAFWQDKLTEALNAHWAQADYPVLVNLASNEYYKAIHSKEIAARIITPVFKDYKNGQYKIISFYAKKARGAMAHWLIKQRITEINKLKDFTAMNYYFVAEKSSQHEWVFYRDGDEDTA